MTIELQSNQQVDLTLPSKVENMELLSLSPKYRQSRSVVSLIEGFIFIIVLFLFSVQPFITLPENYHNNYGFAIAIIILFTLCSAIYNYVADARKKYAIRAFDIHFQSGLIFFSTVSQPIMRIQHIEIKRGPVERITGLATLQVYSAGGANHTFQIPGLVYKQAVALRQYILSHKDINHDG